MKFEVIKYDNYVSVAAIKKPVQSTSKQSSSKSKITSCGDQKTLDNPISQQITSLSKTTRAPNSDKVTVEQRWSVNKLGSATSPASKRKKSPGYWSLKCRLQEEDVKDPTTWKSNVSKLMDQGQAARLH